MFLLINFIISAHAVGLDSLRVAVECQSEGTIDVCAYVEGLIGSTSGLLLVERSHADLMVFTNVTTTGNTEDILVNVASLGDWRPGEYELRRSVNARQDTDELQSVVSQLALEVLSPYILQVWPGSLQMSLEVTDVNLEDEDPGSPLLIRYRHGIVVLLTSGYKNIDVWGGLWMSSVRPDRGWSFRVNGSGGWLKQPPLVIDGVEYALDSQTAEAAWNGVWLEISTPLGVSVAGSEQEWKIRSNDSNRPPGCM